MPRLQIVSSRMLNISFLYIYFISLPSLKHQFYHLLLNILQSYFFSKGLPLIVLKLS